MLMRDRTRGTIPAEIEATRTKVENWRRRRTSQERIPETSVVGGCGTGAAVRDMACGTIVETGLQQAEAACCCGKEGRALNRRFLHRHKDRIAGSISGFDRM